MKPFKEDFNKMLKDMVAYWPWIKEKPYRVERFLRHENCMCKHYPKPSWILNEIVITQIHSNRLLDIVFKALIRAGIRFSTRYVPQRSHEERLTGNLVSEISGAIDLVGEYFKDVSNEDYGEMKQIDFFYYDLSQGGKLEKQNCWNLCLFRR